MNRLLGRRFIRNVKPYFLCRISPKVKMSSAAVVIGMLKVNNELQHESVYLLTCAISKDSDQSEYPCTEIFAGRSLDSQWSEFYWGGQRSLRSDRADVQADLSHLWVTCPEVHFALCGSADSPGQRKTNSPYTVQTFGISLHSNCSCVLMIMTAFCISLYVYILYCARE